LSGDKRSQDSIHAKPAWWGTGGFAPKKKFYPPKDESDEKSMRARMNELLKEIRNAFIVIEPTER
jgi:hypothetical protein